MAHSKTVHRPEFYYKSVRMIIQLREAGEGAALRCVDDTITLIGKENFLFITKEDYRRDVELAYTEFKVTDEEKYRPPTSVQLDIINNHIKRVFEDAVTVYKKWSGLYFTGQICAVHPPILEGLDEARLPVHVYANIEPLHYQVHVDLHDCIYAGFNEDPWYGAYKKISEEAPTVRRCQGYNGIQGEGWEIRIKYPSTKGVLLGVLKPSLDNEMLNDAVRKGYQMMGNIKYHLDDAPNRRALFLEVLREAGKVASDAKTVTETETTARDVYEVEKCKCLTEYSNVEYFYTRYIDAGEEEDVVISVTNLLERFSVRGE